MRCYLMVLSREVKWWDLHFKEITLFGDWKLEGGKVRSGETSQEATAVAQVKVEGGLYSGGG